MGRLVSIREGGGLWNYGQRYRSGERLLLFFYEPSRLGLTSPVEGSLGRIVVDSGGNAVFGNIPLAELSANQSAGQFYGVGNFANPHRPAFAGQSRGSEPVQHSHSCAGNPQNGAGLDFGRHPFSKSKTDQNFAAPDCAHRGCL
jgi:hypothetical protein